MKHFGILFIGLLLGCLIMYCAFAAGYDARGKYLSANVLGAKQDKAAIRVGKEYYIATSYLNKQKLMIPLGFDVKSNSIGYVEPPKTKESKEMEEILYRKPSGPLSFMDPSATVVDIFQTGRVTEGNSFGTILFSNRKFGRPAENSIATREELMKLQRRYSLIRVNSCETFCAGWGIEDVEPIAEVYVETENGFEEGTQEFGFKLLSCDGRWKISEVYLMR